MLLRVHALAGLTGFATIATFWTSTVAVELFGGGEDVATVKMAILWAFLLLIPSLIMAAATGLRLARRRRGPLVDAKRHRMPFIALNGVAVLVPAAAYLALSALDGRFDVWFYAVQAVELVAGATNLTLLGLQIRDGLRLTGRIARPA